jgi:hypothetical protein
MEMNQKVFFNFIYKTRNEIFFINLELIDKREAIVSRFNELSQAVQPLLDAVVTEDATRLIEHQR